MTHKRQTEALVVGAGPVGMFTALCLARSGIHTIIIDQESRTAGFSYACSLHPGTLKLLNQAGLGSTVFRESKRINGVAFYQGCERRAEVLFSSLAVPFPFVMSLPQSHLEDLLEAELRHAGVKVAWNHRLTEVENGPEGVIATVDHLEQSGHGYYVPTFEWTVRDTTEYEARVLIGADGHNSLVRQRLKIPYDTVGVPREFRVFEARAANDSGNEAQVVLDETNDSVMWPLEGSRLRWGFQAPIESEEEFPAKDRNRVVVIERPTEDDSLHQVNQFLKERAPWFDNPIAEVLWKTTVEFEPRLAGQFGHESCWLVGDAAHQTSPVGMQSMNIGLNEAAHLAGAVKKLLREKGSVEQLQRYGQESREKWRRLLGAADHARAPSATDWIRRRATRIVSSIPAAGEDLAVLLSTVGIRY